MNIKSCIILPVVVLSLFSPVSGQAKKSVPEGEVHRVHDKALTVDTHCDTPLNIIRRGFDIGKRNKSGKVDLPRMREGGLDAMFFAVFTPQKARTTANYREAYDLACRMTDTTLSMVKHYGNLAEIALTADDASRIEKAGKRAIYLGMENGFPLAMDLSRIGEFYSRGIRYITLCHSYHNDICDSSSDKLKPEHNGLSGFGRQVVAEMNRLGMIIDVSHISDKSFFDVVSLSRAPVIASHSSVRAIANHRRNLTDDMIRALAKNGGVIQICLLDEYIKNPDPSSEYYRKEQEMQKIYDSRWDVMTEEEKEAFRKKRNELKKNNIKYLPTVSDYVEHIDHVVKLAGVDYVGIGSDFDGGGELSDCRDVSQFPNITRELLRRGYSEADIDKIWGGNFFRVFRTVEEVAARIKSEE